MAYWRKDENCDDPAYMACRAAMEMIKGSDKLQEKLEEKYGCKVQFGIGINYGPAFVGTIGSSVLTDNTVVGNTVNIASWLESKAPAGKIYISRAVADSLGAKGRIFTPVTGFGMKLKEKLDQFLFKSGTKTKNVTKQDVESLE